jgi:type II secretion system protein N
MAEDMSLTVLGWPGLQLKNVEVTLPPQFLGDEVDLAAKWMVIRVGIGGILPPSLSYSMSLSSLKKGGDLYVKVSRAQMKNQMLVSANINISADDVNLEQLPLGPGETITGKLNTNSSIALDMSDLSKTQGDLDLNIQALKTPAQNLQGIIIPTINWGVLKTKISIRNAVADIRNFQIGSTGSDVQGSIAGEIRLGRDFMASFLSISSFKLAFSPAFVKNPNSDTIISMLDSIDKRSPGTYSMKWNKAVAAIAENALINLPEMQ